MRTIVRLSAVSVLWIILALIAKAPIVNIFGVNIIIAEAGITACINVMFPNIIDMGIDKYAKANIFEKLAPVATVLLICYVSTWFTQTIIVAGVVSYYIGNTTAYISKLATERLEGKKKV